MEMSLKILVVDDKPDTLDAIATILRNRGHEVFEASSAQQAIDTFDKTPTTDPFSVILADIKMPGMSGIDLHRRISGGLGQTGYALMTGYRFFEEDPYIKLNRIPILPKPFGPTQLFNGLIRAMATKQAW